MTKRGYMDCAPSTTGLLGMKGYHMDTCDEGYRQEENACIQQQQNQRSIKSFFRVTKTPTTAAKRRNNNDAESARNVRRCTMSPSPGLKFHQSDAIVSSSKAVVAGRSSVDCVDNSMTNAKELPSANLDNLGKVEKAGPSSRRLQQMFLDLGQRDFAKQTLCGICGMLYVHGVEEDLQQHRKICKNFVDGVPFCFNVAYPGTKTSSKSRRKGSDRDSARVIATIEKGVYIIEVRSSDSYSLRKKVSEVGAIVDKELGFARPSFGCHEKKTTSFVTYLYIRNKRVVGFAKTEPVQFGYPLLESKSDEIGGTRKSYSRSTVAEKAFVGIHQVWVHHKFRQSGIASQLIDAVRERSVFGIVVPPNRVAFSSPTEAGVSFAKKYVKSRSSASTSGIVLVYDCI